MPDAEIEEVDEAGHLVATYVPSKDAAGGTSRVDVIKPKDTTSLWQQPLAIFLPAGYPQSVTEDYTWYQIYDSLQAFSSSIAGLLSSRAVLQGVGVGDATASPTAALLLSILQESMGRIATILFAHKLGTALEPECKMYRLAADIFNDSAMVLDCLSPVFPKTVRVVVFSISSVLRALCGVAAGSSKASLSAHFAKWDNLGELNAKDSSQETVISLLGMLAGSLVVSWVSSPLATWSCLILLLSIHLAMNRAAVRAVSMNTLNRQRASILVSEYLSNGKVLSPCDVSERERIFERDGALRWKSGPPIGRAIIGGSLRGLLNALGMASTVTGAVRDQNLLQKILRLCSTESYLIWSDARHRITHIVLKQQASAPDQLKAWAHALLTAQRLASEPLPTGAGPDEMVLLLKEVQGELNSKWDVFIKRVADHGWEVKISHLETSSGLRITCPH